VKGLFPAKVGTFMQPLYDEAKEWQDHHQHEERLDGDFPF